MQKGAASEEGFGRRVGVGRRVPKALGCGPGYGGQRNKADERGRRAKTLARGVSCCCQPRDCEPVLSRARGSSDVEQGQTFVLGSENESVDGDGDGRRVITGSGSEQEGNSEERVLKGERAFVLFSGHSPLWERS